MKGSAPSLERLATAYGLTRQGITDLSNRHGIDRQVLADPDALLVVLLEKGNSSPLRRRLVEPAERLRIATEISI